MDFVQTVRLHQKTECGSRVTPDRVTCPYVVPHAYEFNDVNEAQINRIARLNPASTWLIGNECDRRDWKGGGQDEILPELYALAYHEAYNWIKAADPTAKVAICGLIQASPLRLQYLARVWSAYETEFGVTMPVDVWNIHLFAIREVAGDWGADIPVGIEGVNQGAFLDWKNSHINMDVFAKQIRDFRKFMVDRGQIDKPLLVSEYGVLFGEDDFPDTQVHDFMVATFDHMMNTKDCTLSTVDDCRLVQRWAWFSLADIEWGFNPHTTLYDVNTKNMTPAGEKIPTVHVGPL
ncbi:MAG: hypothetical protein HC802_02185 [Caldilineaceae bacterium]|nr:hypothetical protein [Caldilineaceae bacterium]